MYIAIDSNVIFHDFHLTNPSSQLLLKFARETRTRLLIPRIVLDETFNNFDREIRLAADSINKLLRDDSPKIDINEEITRFKSKFEAKLRKGLNAEILNIPEIAHDALVKRAMMRKRPFNQQGSGYRDALIWFSLLEFLKNTNDTICFVTNDIKAFWNDKRDALHPDLIEDLALADLHKESVSIFANVEDLNAKIIKPKLAAFDEFRTVITKDQFGSLRVKNIIEEYKKDFEHELRGSNLERLLRNSIISALRYLKEPQFVEMEAPTDFKALEVFELSGGDLFIRYEVEIPIVISGWVEDEDQVRRLEREVNFDRDEPRPWNDYNPWESVITGTAFPTLLAEFEVIWRNRTEEVDEFELQHVSF
jgi:hypothetical protein